MRIGDEATAVQLHEFLTRHGVGLSLRCVLRNRELLGWAFRGSTCCQLVRDTNKLKRLEWAHRYASDSFDDVIWTGEASIQLEAHQRRRYRKVGVAPTPKPRPNRPIKVRVWAGISARGATNICIFEGIMDAEFYTQILGRYLVPFIRVKFLSGTHRFMQNNDSRHTSHTTQTFLEDNNINWWQTPPQSPDLNPLENLWHELKEHLRARIKPTNKEDLITGIKSFWATVSQGTCIKYIRHLNQVIPKVIEVEGAATGY